MALKTKLIEVDKDFKQVKYTSIALCPKCGNKTDDICCGVGLIVKESKHKDFLDSLIPLLGGIYKCSDRSKTT